MKIKNVGLAIKNTVNKIGFWGKKNSPEILIGTGIVLVVGAIGTAIYATTKLDKVTKPLKEKVGDIHKKMEDEKIKEIDNENYISEYNGKKELTKAYANGALGYVKLYLPSAVCLSLSIACILSSHNISKGRELAASAAYMSVSNAYQEYRKRVQEKIGSTAEKEIYYNAKEEEVEVEEIDKKGKIKKTTEKVLKYGEPASEWKILFDESRKNWVDNANYNLDYLFSMESMMNYKLQTKGYLLLADVFDALDIDPTSLSPEMLKASKLVGWTYDKDNKNEKGDNFVSFGLRDEYGQLTPQAAMMKYYNEKNIWLEFNCDGNIITCDYDDSYMKYVKII